MGINAHEMKTQQNNGLGVLKESENEKNNSFPTFDMHFSIVQDRKCFKLFQTSNNSEVPLR